jgi:hypothetical protein
MVLERGSNYGLKSLTLSKRGPKVNEASITDLYTSFLQNRSDLMIYGS